MACVRDCGQRGGAVRHINGSGAIVDHSSLYAYDTGCIHVCYVLIVVFRQQSSTSNISALPADTGSFIPTNLCEYTRSPCIEAHLHVLVQRSPVPYLFFIECGDPLAATISSSPSTCQAYDRILVDQIKRLAGRMKKNNKEYCSEINVAGPTHYRVRHSIPIPTMLH